MKRYFVQRIEKNRKTGILYTVIEGKEDIGYDLGQFLAFQDRMYMVSRYGFATVPAAKRSWAYRNQSDNAFSTVEDVKIVEFTVDEGGVVTMKDVVI